LRDEFYDVAKVTIIHRKIWPNLVYKLNMEISFLEKPSTFVAPELNHVKKSSTFSKKIGQILAIENVKKAL